MVMLSEAEALDLEGPTGGRRPAYPQPLPSEPEPAPVEPVEPVGSEPAPVEPVGGGGLDTGGVDTSLPIAGPADPYFDPPLPSDVTPDPTDGPIPSPTIDPTIPTGNRPDAIQVQDLYPTAPEGQEMPDIEVGTVEGADTVEADAGVTDVGTPGTAETDTGSIVDDAVAEITGSVGTGEQTALTAEQQVDAELARILGQDSPLLAQARAQAMQLANQRGLMNTSMAAGMGMDAMTKAALPMAQQNAAQAAARELENTRNRQESGLFTADQLARLRSLEAELGQDLSIFNADQLNQAERLGAELRTAIEQQNAQAYNEAALQLAELQRNAQAQQAEIDYASGEREFLERQAYNEQIIDAVTKLNEQYMIGEQNVDIENIRGTYNSLIATNESAARIFDSYINSIGAIFDDPKMSSAQAAEAIGAMQTMLEASLRMMSEINGIDFGDIAGTVPGGESGEGETTTTPPSPYDPYTDPSIWPKYIPGF